MIKLEATNWSIENHLMVSFFLPGPISSEVWQDYCAAIASPEVTKILAASIGAVEVDSVQRSQLNLAMREPPAASAAVVTDEALVRGLMTATAWLGRIDIKTFAWHKLGEAFRHLAPEGISEARALELVDTVRQRAEASR